ncbi:MAG: glycosyltransferase [Paenibacillus sp.]|uniref:glycosyltransferase family 2 protein n=1 Tax=Paenibacillus sp. TaxID=58172 RepID=UPI0029019AA1|nr:glycosyltransferase [Paenibacillus sp.]MDU2242790.1 glycosyltransferase [Paenibacillus sp.]
MQRSVAVIIRTKDRPLLLARALQSVGQQTYKDWEIVVVNNGGNLLEVESTISSFKITNESAQIKLVNLIRPEFMEVATNRGILNTVCKYISILDDDDTWDPFFLETCMKVLNENNSIDGVVSQSIMVYEKITDRKIVEIRKEKFNPNLTAIKKYSILRRNLYTTNSFIYKKENIEEIGFYREDLPVLGDWEFNLRFALNRKIVVIAQPLSFYHKRINVNSKSYANTNYLEHLKYDYIIRKEYFKKFQREGRILEAAAIILFGFLNRSIRYIKKMLN